MNRIWWFGPIWPNVPWMQGFGRYCRYTNAEEMTRARSDSQNFSPVNFPIARLELTIEQFSLDCFCWDAYILVSQDLRNAIALNTPDVQYFPVDASLSAPLPRSKNYMIMRVPVTEEMSDLDRSDYHYTEAIGWKGTLFWNRIAIKRDFQPKHEMFRDSFFSRLILCTDKCAVSILRSGCTGMQFSDLEHCRRRNRSRFRSLRGLEEETRGRNQEIVRIRLVQEMAPPQG